MAPVGLTITRALNPVAEQKRWWRNLHDRPDVDVLLAGHHRAMRATVEPAGGLTVRLAPTAA